MTNIAVYSKEQNQLISQTLLPENKKYIPLHFEHKKIKNFNEGDYKNLYIYLVKLCEISGVTKPSGEVLKSIVVFGGLLSVADPLTVDVGEILLSPD